MSGWSVLDKIGGLLSRVTRGRFQWPCWLLDFAWNWQATPHPNDRRLSDRVRQALRVSR